MNNNTKRHLNNAVKMFSRLPESKPERIARLFSAFESIVLAKQAGDFIGEEWRIEHKFLTDCEMVIMAEMVDLLSKGN